MLPSSWLIFWYAFRDLVSLVGQQRDLRKWKGVRPPSASHLECFQG